MKTYAVLFDRDAQNDLDEIFAYIQEKSGQARAEAYLKRVYEFCSRMGELPERFPFWRRGAAPIRIAVFERSMSIAFETRDTEVVILRILARGRDQDIQLRRTEKP